MSRDPVKRAFLASPRYRRLLAMEQGGPSARSRAGSAMHGTGIVGANRGAGPAPNGYLYGYDHGTAIEGANPGGGPVPSGYLDGYDSDDSPS
jgi:hypothetical protein